MYRVTRIDPVSWAKNYTLAAIAIVVVLFVIALIPLGFVAVVSLISSEGDGTAAGVAAAAIGGILGFVAVTIAIAISVFVVSLIQGVAFNWALGKTGGLAVGLGLAEGPAAEAPEEP